MAMRRKARTARPTGRLPGLMVAPPCLQVPPMQGHSEIGPMAADLTDPPGPPRGNH
jgi:hypothetical protein